MPTALIWGASGGIGAALVRTLKQAGWRVFAAARDTSRVPAEADDVLAFDVHDRGTLRDVNFALASESDGVELVVYAVGSLRADKLTDLAADDWATVLSSNLTGAYLAASHSVSLLNESGHMVFIGAYIDHVILPKMGAYAVAKAGLDPLVGVLRKEHRKRRFTLVRPGAVDTAFWEHAPFRKPPDSKPPEAVARAILEHHNAGTQGDLNL